MINKRKRLRLIFPIIILLILGSRLIKRTPLFKVETFYPEKTEYISQLESIGYLILDEEVYTASGDGIVEYEVSEGVRVPKDQTVATLSLTEDISDLKEELLRVQSAIEYKNQSLNPKTEDYKISTKEINLIRSIQEAVNEDNTEKSLIAIETLELNTKKNVDISQIGELISLSNQQLEDIREDLSRKIGTNNAVYKSGRSGIVSMDVDGLEDKLKYHDIENLDIGDIKDLQNYQPYKITSEVKKGSPLYKIVDNYDYYVATVIEDNSYFDDLEIGDRLILVLDSIEITARTEIIQRSNGEVMIIARAKDKLMELGYQREHHLSLITDKDQAFDLPTHSIVEKEGIPGVYTKELNGLIRFVPVDIIYQKDQHTLVSTGDEGKIYKNNKELKTITIYDQIILDPGSIQEGQVI